MILFVCSFFYFTSPPLYLIVLKKTTTVLVIDYRREWKGIISLTTSTVFKASRSVLYLEGGGGGRGQQVQALYKTHYTGSIVALEIDDKSEALIEPWSLLQLCINYSQFGNPLGCFVIASSGFFLFRFRFCSLFIVF